MMILSTMVLLFAALLSALGLIGVAIDPAGWPALLAGLLLFTGTVIARRRTRARRPSR